eukprot:TRINITY_DN6430_c0_g1_i1.p1 TRINITY_DN6430_c0_g1~~TRINITY_DN6430_c0_g1_i1.p1  ORF type:complete len:187 (-),score=13.51 TRINITY_DN6430_c0_g1_i1:168-728(-)
MKRERRQSLMFQAGHERLRLSLPVSLLKESQCSEIVDEPKLSPKELPSPRPLNDVTELPDEINTPPHKKKAPPLPPRPLGLKLSPRILDLGAFFNLSDFSPRFDTPRVDHAPSSPEKIERSPELSSIRSGSLMRARSASSPRKSSPRFTRSRIVTSKEKKAAEAGSPCKTGKAISRKKRPTSMLLS